MTPPHVGAVAMTPAAAQHHDAASVADPARQGELDLTIFVSCYNEQDFIIQTLTTVREALAEIGNVSYEIVVIDDCSRDRSAELVEDYIGRNPDAPILLRRNRLNRGLAQRTTSTPRSSARGHTTG